MQLSTSDSILQKYKEDLQKLLFESLQDISVKLVLLFPLFVFASKAKLGLEKNRNCRRDDEK